MQLNKNYPGFNPYQRRGINPTSLHRGSFATATSNEQIEQRSKDYDMLLHPALVDLIDFFSRACHCDMCFIKQKWTSLTWPNKIQLPQEIHESIPHFAWTWTHWELWLLVISSNKLILHLAPLVPSCPRIYDNASACWLKEDFFPKVSATWDIRVNQIDHKNL